MKGENLMPYDYSTAPLPRDSELIPHGTTATVVMHIRPGGAGEDGLLKRSKTGDCEMLDIEYVVVDGPHARRKFWENQIVVGTTQGQKEMAEAHIGTRKAILQSARNIKEGDVSPQAREAYRADLKDFDGLMFIAKIGIEKGKPKNAGSNENWPDKNVLAAVITPDKADWHQVTQAPPFNSGGNSSATAPSSSPTPGAPGNSPPIAPPAWAR
jgi:hypothetical protein